jgi:hypothetical protein
MYYLFWFIPKTEYQYFLFISIHLFITLFRHFSLNNILLIVWGLPINDSIEIILLKNPK